MRFITLVLPIALLSIALAPHAMRAQAGTTGATSSTRSVAVLTADAARRALAAAEVEAKKNGWAVSIAVVDPAGELLAFVRLDGASPASVDIARAKARTAARLRRPTKVLEESVTGGRTVILSLEGIVAVEGGVPIVVGGEMVGAIGISGVTSAQDGIVANAGANAVTR